MSENAPKIINDKDVDLIAVITDFFTVIPVASFAVAGYRSISQLNEDQFNEKLKMFMEGINPTNEEKIAFAKVLNKDAGEFFKRLLKVLDRIEDKAKVPIVSRLLTHTMKGRLTVEEFKRLCSTIDNTYLLTLEYLSRLETLPVWEIIQPSFKKRTDYEKKQKETEQDVFEKQQLVAIGFLIERPNSYTELQHGTNRVTEQKDYFLTSLGSKFLLYGLNGK